MSSTRNVGLGILTTFEQMVANLDSQRQQLMEAVERDHSIVGIRNQIPSTPAEVTLIQEHIAVINRGRDHAYRELAPVLTEIAHAREALVDAHNLLRDIVAPIDMMREARR